MGIQKLKSYIFVTIICIFNFVFCAIGDVIQSFSAPGYYSDGLAWDGENLWVANIADAAHSQDYWYRIFKVSPETGEVISSFSTNGYYYHGLTHDGENLWGERLYTWISKLTDEGQVIYNINAVPLAIGLAFDKGNNILYQTTTQPGSIILFNPETGEQLDSLYPPEATENGWGDLAFDGTYLWHTNVATELIYKIDPSDGSILTQFAAPNTQCEGLTFDGQYLWTSDTGQDMLYQIDIEFDSCGVWQSGDSNLDGMINILDIIELVNYVISDTNVGDCQLTTMDVNGDGNYDILDMVALVAIILG
ncbi:MAG: hypothetical protein H8E72_03880 [Candidatus Marinimicrobia bacterium]|nr:hypothetical protein [Candidatus Neomarinimicrobiota bacterium]